MEKVKNISIVIGVFVLAFVSVAHSLERVLPASKGNNTHQQARENTWKNSFIVACAQEGASKAQGS